MNTFSYSGLRRLRFATHHNIASSFSLLLTAALVPLLCSSAYAVPLNPSDFASLGALPAGGFTIDTEALTFGGVAGGVLHVQGGGAPDIAVFTFDGGSILANGEAITVTGDHAFALLFQGSATLAGTIDVSGGDGIPAVQNVVTGIRGMGVAGGGDGGNGGPFSSGREGIGPGHGLAGSSSPSVFGVGSGSGGGFGTMGGFGGAGHTFRMGGSPYGDPLRDLLFAGSGGGGGGGQSNSRLGGGGGAGGGAVEIGALASLEFTSATILANGGNGSNGFADGGGGSGGGILLHAFQVAMDSATLIQASGGEGGEGTQPGGCGGAGRIEILHHPSGSFSDFGTMEANAGAFGGDCTDGMPVITETTEVGVPEPSTALLALGAFATLFMLSRNH